MMDDKEFGKKMYPEVVKLKDDNQHYFTHVYNDDRYMHPSISIKQTGDKVYLDKSEVRALAQRYYECCPADLAQVEAVRGLVEAAQKLKLASEMRRAWDIHNEEEFNEIYPDEEGWASGDVDENLIQGIEDITAALAAFEVNDGR